MFRLIKKILEKKSICRSLQEIESRKFMIGSSSLEIGNFDLNKKSFFNFFEKKKNTKFFFSDTQKIKNKNYIKLDLEKKKFN